MALKAMFSPLLTVLPDGSVDLFLAESYDISDDGLTYTMHLRPNVSWHDGEPVTSFDVAFTYQALIDTPAANGHSKLNFGDQGQVEIEVVDNLTLNFTFPFMNPAGLEAFSARMIAPRHIYEGVEDWKENEANLHPIGCGPYAFEEYLPGQHLKLRANEDYFLGTPNIETVIYQIVLNENTGQIAIQSGEIDCWVGTPAQIEQMSLEASNLKVTPYSEARVASFVFNTRRVPNENIRRAFFLSLDKKTIADASLLSDEYYALVNSFSPPENSFYSEDHECYERDVEAAKALLEQEGEPHPTIVIAYGSDDSLQATAAVLMQEQASEAGFNVEVLGVDTAALGAAKKEADNSYDLYYSGYIMGADPSTYSSLFRSDGVWNYAHYTHEDYPQIDDLFDAGLTETDPEKRREIYKELQTVIAESAMHYPLYSNMRLLVTSKKIGGIEEAKLVPSYTIQDLSKLHIEE